MEQISNKTLTFLLLIAIVVSIVGTMISINRLNQLIPRITGFAGTTEGKVNITLASIASITITDSQIDFGSCTSIGTYGVNITSNSTSQPSTCTAGGTWPDNITVKNDGNTNINVTVQTNALASTFIQGDEPYGPLFMFSVRNSSDTPGCFNQTGAASPSGFDGATGMQWAWKNFSEVDTGYLACANLTPTTNYQSMYVFAKIFLPANTPPATDTNATLTFTAANW